MPQRRRPKLPQYLTAPPAGMWYESSRAAEKPCRARWRRTDGSKESRGFPDAETRAAFAVEWVKQRAEFGAAASMVEADTVRMLAEFSALTGGADPLEVARWWAKVRGTLGGDLTVAEAVRRYLALRDSRPAAADTLNHLQLHLRRLAEHFTARRLGDVRPDDLRAWLAGLRSPRLGSATMSEASRRHHYLSANQLFRHAVREGWLERSPMEAVEAPSWGAREELGLLTVAQAHSLFEANRHEPVVARLALEAFGGLRASSAGRLEGAHVAWAHCGIELPGALHKSGRRHFVDGQPPNLWRWLGAFAFTPAAWAMSERMYAQEKSRAFARAQITRPPHNCLRHSFATYHLAAHKDPGRTAVLMQHRRSPEILWRHYVGRATAADGHAFFSIVP